MWSVMVICRKASGVTDTPRCRDRWSMRLASARRRHPYDRAFLLSLTVDNALRIFLALTHQKGSLREISGVQTDRARAAIPWQRPLARYETAPTRHSVGLFDSDRVPRKPAGMRYL